MISFIVASTMLKQQCYHKNMSTRHGFIVHSCKAYIAKYTLIENLWTGYVIPAAEKDILLLLLVSLPTRLVIVILVMAMTQFQNFSWNLSVRAKFLYSSQILTTVVVVFLIISPHPIHPQIVNLNIVLF